MLKQFLIAFALSFVAVWSIGAARSQPHQQEQIMQGSIPGCPPVTQFVANAKKELPGQVKARIFTIDEVRKLAGKAVADQLEYDTVAILYFKGEFHALAVYGNGGKVCHFVLAPAQEVREFIDKQLSGRRAGEI